MMLYKRLLRACICLISVFKIMFREVFPYTPWTKEKACWNYNIYAHIYTKKEREKEEDGEAEAGNVKDRSIYVE